MNKLTYKDGKWKFTIDGKDVTDKVVEGNIQMSALCSPTIDILIDEIEIDDVKTRELKGNWYDGTEEN